MSAAIEARAVDLLWKQWTVLGVAGVGTLPQQAVDLEALIAFTPFVAAADPRLVAESADWCARIGKSFVSISRLRQILKLMPPRSVQAELDLPAMVLGEEKPSDRRLSGKSRAPALEHSSLLQLRSRFVFGVGARADILARFAMKARVEGGQRIPSLGRAAIRRSPSRRYSTSSRTPASSRSTRARPACGTSSPEARLCVPCSRLFRAGCRRGRSGLP